MHQARNLEGKVMDQLRRFRRLVVAAAREFDISPTEQDKTCLDSLCYEICVNLSHSDQQRRAAQTALNLLVPKFYSEIAHCIKIPSTAAASVTFCERAKDAMTAMCSQVLHSGMTAFRQLQIAFLEAWRKLSTASGRTEGRTG